MLTRNISALFLTLAFLPIKTANTAGLIPFAFKPLPNNRTCPANYVAVWDGGNINFCIMQFEAKNVGGVATSQAALQPWSGVTAMDSKNACRALGSNYDLVSNYEWVVTGYNIENNPLNWTDGAVGTGMLYTGHTDNAPAASLDVDDTTNLYDQTGNSAASGKDQRRAHYMPGGELLWDLGGNVAEWVDFGRDSTFTDWPTCPSGSIWKDYKDVTCTDYLLPVLGPWNPAGITAANYTSATYGLGQFWGGTGGSARRGAHWNDADPRNGIYFANLSTAPNTGNSSSRGFRCVYRFETPTPSGRPTNLTISHTPNSRNLTFSYTAGTQTGTCRLQYHKDASTWTYFGGTYNCATSVTAQAEQLPSTTTWTNTNFLTGVTIRLVRTEDLKSMGTFPELVTCSATTGSATPTPDIDEDCDRTWDDFDGTLYY